MNSNNSIVLQLRRHAFTRLLQEAFVADGATSPDGRVQGTYVHGLFASDAFRAAWTELPSCSSHTGRPVAKSRKWLPIGFAAPVVLARVATGSVKSHVPSAWQAYFCTPVA